MIKQVGITVVLVASLWFTGPLALRGLEPGNPDVVSIQPNPVRDVLKVNFRLYNEFYIELYDITGKKLSSQTFRSTRDSSEISLNMNQLRQGLYLLKVYDRQGQVKKVFKIDKVTR